VDLTGFPVTSTLMGLGAFPAARPEWLGMLGMHGTWEANHAMHDCDLMICLGARFDDRCTGKVSSFSPKLEENPPGYRRLADQQDRAVDLGIVADATKALREMVRFWKSRSTRCRRRLERVVGADRPVARVRSRWPIAARTVSSSRNMPSTGCTR
jgi:acetolactate synthase-1/2/3 large subunit